MRSPNTLHGGCHWHPDSATRRHSSKNHPTDNEATGVEGGNTKSKRNRTSSPTSQRSISGTVVRWIPMDGPGRPWPS